MSEHIPPREEPRVVASRSDAAIMAGEGAAVFAVDQSGRRKARRRTVGCRAAAVKFRDLLAGMRRPD